MEIVTRIIRKICGALPFLFAVTLMHPAGIAINGWGRAVLSPAGSAADDTVGSTMAGTWGSDSNAGIAVTGTSDSIGFRLEYDFNPRVLISPSENTYVKSGSNQNLWVKPFPNLTMTLGKFVIRELGGSASYGLQQWLCFGYNNVSRNGSSTTFRVIGGRRLGTDFVSSTDRESGIGGMLMFSGIKNVLAYMVYDVGASQEDAQEAVHGTASSKDMLAAYSTYGAIWTVNDFWTLKAQYIGEGYDADNEMMADINVATDISSAERFLLRIGSYIPINRDASVKYDPTTYAAYSIYRNQTLITAYSEIRMGTKTDGARQFPVTAHLLVQDGISTTTNSSDFGLGMGFDFALSNEYTINTDVRWSQDDGIDTDGNTADSVMFLIGIVKNFEHGNAGIGFEGATNGVAPSGYASTVNGYLEKNGRFGWAVPVKIEYWF